MTTRRLPGWWSRLLEAIHRRRAALASQPLTRKEFYDLAGQCVAYAQHLAAHDQSRVHLKSCYEFNSWLAALRRYDRLGPALASMGPAWPVARWQIMTLFGVVGLMTTLTLSARVDRAYGSFFLYGVMFSLLVLFFLPDRIYGTTVELLEGKVLRVVEEMDKLLQSGEMGMTEAVFFQVKQNLEQARRELRQQIDLAHRRL
jgi:hypothetical protein